MEESKRKAGEDTTFIGNKSARRTPPERGGD